MFQRIRKVALWVLMLSMILVGMSEEILAEKMSYSNSSSNEVYVTFDLEETETWGTTQVNKYVMNLHNTGSQSICNWEVTINLSTNVQWNSGWGWCADFEAKGNSLIITPLSDGSMGNSVAAYSTYSSAGFYLYSSAADFSNVQVAYEYGTQSTPNDSENDIIDSDVVLTGITKTLDYEDTPVGKHGELSVNGTHLVDKNGENFQLRGVSTHGINWFPEYVDKTGFNNLRDEWGVNAVRLAMYTIEYNGYCAGGDQNSLKNLVKNGVQYATDLGMYVIIDWHILNDNNPKTNMESAKTFFAEMSSLYANYDNVLYEICNEPNGGTSWSDIKEYAETIIPIIKANNPNAVIIVGTPTWSQDVDIASLNPITGYSNIMYTIHFYSATHGQSYRDKVATALANGLPVFCTEYGVCESWGGGSLNLSEANAWLDMFDTYDISYFCWALTNKDESASLLKSTTNKTSGYLTSDLSQAGIWLVKEYNERNTEVDTDNDAPGGGDTDNDTPGGGETDNDTPGGGETDNDTPEIKIPDGLALADDGNWYLYKDGVVDSTYTGLYGDVNYGWWYVENGVINFGYNGLYGDANYGWWLVKGGAVDFAYTGLYYDVTVGWWLVEGGSINFGYTGLYGDVNYGWWLVTGGRVCFEYTGLYGDVTVGWWYVEGGAINFNYTGLYCDEYCGWWLVTGGRVCFEYTGLVYDPIVGWWYVEGGAINFSYTGPVAYNGGTFNVVNGMVIF